MATSSTGSLIETLRNKGWYFDDVTQIKTITESGGASSIESHLCNLDIRSFGSKSLPDPSTLRKSTHLTGPIVLQVVSVRDISKSTVAESLSSSGSSGKRLLRLKLTDGHSDVVAIEFTHIPSIPDNVVPGTKLVILRLRKVIRLAGFCVLAVVDADEYINTYACLIRLENKVVIHNGILCLNARVVTVLGGIVPSLYEEWEMNQKYAGFSRSTLKSSQSDDTGGPPPFQKLQTGAPSRRQQNRSFDPKATSKVSGPTVIEKGVGSGSSQSSGSRPFDLKATSSDDKGKPDSLINKPEQKQPAPEARPKEGGTWLMPSCSRIMFGRGGKVDEVGDLEVGNQREGKDEMNLRLNLLDEWERKRATGSSSLRQETPNVNQDEDLARQLQNQFDLEDYHVSISSLCYTVFLRGQLIVKRI
ncbi:tudor domain-containing protein 3 [Tanacetum coccineum]